MKKVVRLKIKHILLITSVTLLVGMILYFSMPTIMLEIGNRLHSNGELLKAKGHYDNINERFPTSAAAERALESSGYISAVSDKILISSAGHGSLQHPVPYLSIETEMYYEEIVTRFPNSYSAKRIRYDLLSKDIREKIDKGHIEDALNMAKDFYLKVNDSTPKYIDSFTIIGIIRAFEVKGYYDEAEDLLNFIINYEDDWTKTEFQNLLEQVKKSKESNGKVTGKVTLQHKPFKELPIFLQFQDMKDGTLFGYTHDAYWTKTDKDGNFIFENVPEGRYTIGIVADLDDINDKVIKNKPFEPIGFNVVANEDYNFNIEFIDKVKLISPINGDKITGETIKFQWSPLQEASYYALTLGISSDGAISYRNYGKKYYSAEAIVPMEDIYYMEGLIGFDEQGPIPEAFLAYLNPNATIFWGVNAYDENNNIISSSNGFIKDHDTNLSLEKRKLTKGDKKILERDYKGAIEVFEENIEKNSADIHALLMLARLYGFEDNHPYVSYPYTDTAKSKTYYKRLYEITKNEVFLDKLYE